MTWIAAGSLAGNVVIVFAFLAHLSRSSRPYVRREDLLIDKILNLAGKPWTPAPASELPDELFDESRFVTTTDQLPDF